MAKSSLSQYRAKRDFASTGEPRGGARRKRRRGKLRFVVQEHDASSLHYDFRLEMDGVLKSWAVPKGPSTDPRQRRLAVRTEDHPLDYAQFEGVIPEDQYGAGSVIVWDAGTYRLRGDDAKKKTPEQELRAGHLSIWLDGEKLRGGYALQRIAKGGKGEQERWLLIKVDDDEADARRRPVSTQPESVLSGRTVEEVEEQEREQKSDGGERRSRRRRK